MTFWRPHNSLMTEFCPEGTSQPMHLRESRSTDRLPRWLSGGEPAYQCWRCRSCGFYPWVGTIPWRRKWQPTPVLLPVKTHGQRSLVYYSPWGCEEPAMIEWLSMHTHFFLWTTLPWIQCLYFRQCWMCHVASEVGTWFRHNHRISMIKQQPRIIAGITGKSIGLKNQMDS